MQMQVKVRVAVKFSRLGNFANSYRRQSTYPPIADFYAGRSVFVTGGTGFVGKVLIDKLLRCKDINKIYVLARKNKNESADQRVDNMLSVPIFNNLRETQPEDLKKIVAVNGDITEPNLGISPADAETVKKEVSVVFHSAASVRFNDKLQNLLKFNTIGTQRVADFSSKIKDLKVFVYVSTAYSQCQDDVIEERIYPEGNLADLLRVQEKYDDNPKKYNYVLQGRKNPYTLSKAMAENIIAQKNTKHNLPAVIVRPSIITPLYKSPLPGWIDNWYATTGLAHSLMLGHSHVLLGKKTNLVDIIPVDYVVNCMLVAAARYTSHLTLPVINLKSLCTILLVATVTPLGSLFYDMVAHSRKIGQNELPAGMVVTDSKLLLNLIKLTTEYIPAFFVDSWQILRGEKPWYNKALKIMDTQRSVIHPFITCSWVMRSSNTENLAATLSPEDRKIFSFDLKEIVWKEYIPIYLQGIVKYMMPRLQKKNLKKLG